MSEPAVHDLSRRERQIMQELHRLQRATAAEVRESIPDPPSYTAVNTLLRILVDKGHVQRTQDGKRYVYAAKQPIQNAARSAMHNLIQTFFGGNVEKAVTTMLSERETALTSEQLNRLSELIERARNAEPVDPASDKSTPEKGE